MVYLSLSRRNATDTTVLDDCRRGTITAVSSLPVSFDRLSVAAVNQLPKPSEFTTTLLFFLTASSEKKWKMQALLIPSLNKHAHRVEEYFWTANLQREEGEH